MTDWRARARCLGMHALFRRANAASRAVCAECDVRAECLDDALATEGPDCRLGVRGGLGPGARQKEWRRRQGVPLERLIAESDAAWALMGRRFAQWSAQQERNAQITDDYQETMAA